MRFIVGDFELNLVAMIEEVSGTMHVSRVADKEKGARDGWVSQEKKCGLESVKNEQHLER